MLWYPLSPIAALWFVAIVPSKYLAGVIACLSDDRLAPSFRRHLARQAAINTRAYSINHRQPPRVSDQSRGKEGINLLAVIGPKVHTAKSFTLWRLDISAPTQVWSLSGLQNNKTLACTENSSGMTGKNPGKYPPRAQENAQTKYNDTTAVYGYYCTYWAIGVKDRSIVQLRVILITLSPPLNGGVFGESVPYTAVRWPTRFVSLHGEPGRHVFRGAHAQAFLYEKRSKWDLNPCPRRRSIWRYYLMSCWGKRSTDYPPQGNPCNSTAARGVISTLLFSRK